MTSSPSIAQTQRRNAEAFAWLLVSGRALLIPARPSPTDAPVNPMPLWYFSRMLTREKFPWAYLPQPASGIVTTRIQALQAYTAVDALEILRTWAEAAVMSMAPRGVHLEYALLEFFQQGDEWTLAGQEAEAVGPAMVSRLVDPVEFTQHAALVTFLLHAQQCAALFGGDWFPSMAELDDECSDYFAARFLELYQMRRLEPGPWEHTGPLHEPMRNDRLRTGSVVYTFESPQAAKAIKDFRDALPINSKLQIVGEQPAHTTIGDLLETWRAG